MGSDNGSNALPYGWYFLVPRFVSFLDNLNLTDLQLADGWVKQAGVRARGTEPRLLEHLVGDRERLRQRLLGKDPASAPAPRRRSALHTALGGLHPL